VPDAQLRAFHFAAHGCPPEQQPSTDALVSVAFALGMASGRPGAPAKAMCDAIGPAEAALERASVGVEAVEALMTRLLRVDVLADDIARALAPRLCRIIRPAEVPPDDAYVDQDAGLFDREVYLRLARKGYFPVTKEGRPRVARWGDVKAGFAKAGRTDIKVVEQTDDPEADLLDEIRARAGLQVKGGR
jgi:hypothetical protein